MRRCALLIGCLNGGLGHGGQGFVIVFRNPSSRSVTAVWKRRESQSLAVSEVPEPAPKLVEMVAKRRFFHGWSRLRQQDLSLVRYRSQFLGMPEVAGAAAGARLDKRPDTLIFAGKGRIGLQLSDF